jgi:hypothetical protein
MSPGSQMSSLHSSLQDTQLSYERMLIVAKLHKQGV